MRILIRTSKWAIWSRRLGSLAVPMVVLPVLLHHMRIIDSPGFHVAAIAAFLVASCAVLAALIAVARLWHTGDHGWGRALAGLFLGVVCLTPFAYFGWLAMRYPLATDLSTLPRNQLPLLFDVETVNMPPAHILPPAEQLEYFPNVTTRVYPVAPVDLFAVAERIVNNNGWEIRLRTEPTADAPGRLVARVVTLVGWHDEVVLRVSPAPQGAVLDMRSVSLNAPRDFGSNGQRISDFLNTLDADITAFIRDNPNLGEPAEADTEASPDVETGEEG